jgi:hypothetical protein
MSPIIQWQPHLLRREAPLLPRAPTEHREMGARVRQVEEAINLAGGREVMPKVMREREEGVVYVSCGARGASYELCPRKSSHIPLSPAKATPFHAWCALAYT